MLQYLLRKEGHAVTGAPTHHSALLAAGQDRFDCLVSDLGLPDGTGLDLMRELRNAYPELRGIALSGYGMEDDYAKSRDAGFALHLTKPIDFDRLQEAITRVMEATPDQLPLEGWDRM
jgi:CheY-like chemotaxis protein